MKSAAGGLPFGMAGKDFAYIDDKTPEQKAFNRRRFFTDRMKAANRASNYLLEIDRRMEIARQEIPFHERKGPSNFWMRYYSTSALYLMNNNRIIHDEAKGLRKATLS